MCVGLSVTETDGDVDSESLGEKELLRVLEGDPSEGEGECDVLELGDTDRLGDADKLGDTDTDLESERLLDSLEEGVTDVDLVAPEVVGGNEGRVVADVVGEGKTTMRIRTIHAHNIFFNKIQCLNAKREQNCYSLQISISCTLLLKT